MNILLLSVGTRNKIVQYFKGALTSDCGEREGYVVATDMSRLAPALYEADRYVIVPSIKDEHYIDIVLDICKKYDIKAVTSLIDPELELLANHKNRFKTIGVEVVCSDSDICKLCLNKMKMYHWLVDHGYNTAKSFDDIDLFRKAQKIGDISFPVFVKPISGSASLNINIVHNYEELQFIFNNSEGLMIQEYLKGKEIGADVYIDLISRDVVSIFTKEKLLMRAGETDKSVSFKDSKLFAFIETFVSEVGFIGQIDIDLFIINGRYYISEVNPRFGGGYPHAYESGCDHTKLIINNLKGISNRKTIGDYEDNIIMMKYNEIMIKRGN